MVTRRGDNQLSDLGSAVNKVRRTAKGNLLLEVAKGSKGSAECMRDSISRVLGDAAEVRALTEYSKVCVFVIRDLDAITSESEIRNAFTKQCQLSLARIREADGFVRAEVGGFWMYSCYLAPSLPLEAFSRILNELCYDLRGRANVIVGGDFNAWAQEWGSTATNARGRVVLVAFASTDVVLLNHGERHTFVRAGAASIIDLTFASSAISHNVKWEISD
ncbi:hypothetical protein KR059_009581, partial [Drosophila kikkawai]